MKLIEDFLHLISSNATVVFYGILGLSVLIIVMLVALTRRLHDIWRIYRQISVYLEITPPLEANKTPEATEQFFNNLYGICTSKKLRHKIIGVTHVLSLEVISTKSEGVRYIIRTNELLAQTVEQSVTAFLSNSRVKRIEDPLIDDGGHFSVVNEFYQSKHYAFPIRTFDTYELHDPIAYITGAINRLSDGEQIALQLVITPARVRNMAKIVQRYYEFYKVSEAKHNKAYSQLFRSELRLRVVANSEKAGEERVRSGEAAITSLDIPKVQMLKARYNFPNQLRGKYRKWAFRHRMPSIIPRNSNIFSSLELASLFHFPANRTTQEGIVTSLSRTLAPPLTLRNSVDGFDLVIGSTNHHGESIPIGMTSAERQKHLYILGGTGNGKTTMMQYAILQDIKGGKGLAVIDPHGDMAETLLKHIPEERVKDVVYFNPDDIDYPISINMLELPSDLSANELLRHKDLVTETLISVFRKIFSEGENGGSRIEAALRNTIQTALTLENPTMVTLYKLINDPKYRKRVVESLQDERLKDYWINEIGEAGGMQRVKMLAGITTKIGRFLFSASAERVLDYPHSTIDFEDIINSKKIFICNLSKGLLGEDTSELFGVMVIAKLQMAALRRARLSHAERVPFYLYVDEFQNFATPSFVEMLAEARKYKLFLTMAEQTTSQQSREMVNKILANVGTVVAFRSGNPADEQMLLPLFSPFLEHGELANLPTYNFFARLAAVKSQEPVSGTTIVIDEAGSEDIATKVIASSRELYARHYVAKAHSKAISEPKSTRTIREPSVEIKRVPDGGKDSKKQFDFSD